MERDGEVLLTEEPGSFSALRLAVDAPRPTDQPFLIVMGTGIGKMEISNEPPPRATASEQAINRLSGYRWEFPQKRELTGK